MADLNRRERWVVRPALWLLRPRPSGREKTNFEMSTEWWLWRFAGTKMPWDRWGRPGREMGR